MIVAAIFGARFFSGGSEKKGAIKRVYYIKDDALMSFSLFSHKSRVEVENVFDDFKDNAQNSERSFTGSEINVACNGKYLIHPKNYNGDTTYGMDLYYRPLNSKKESERLVRGVSGYVVLPEQGILYRKADDEYSLYYNDMKEEKRLSGDSSNFFITEEKNRVLWHEEGTDKIFLQDLDNKSEKIKLGTGYVSSYTDNFEYVLIRDSEALYFTNDRGEDEKLSSKYLSARLIDSEQSCDAYWTENVGKGYTQADFIDTTMEEIQEPGEEDI